MKKLLLSCAVALIAAAAIAHWYFSDRGRWTTEPETTGLARIVSGQDLVSDFDPPLVMRFDPALRYLGGQKFVLYGVADTEQHFFIETTADDRLESLYWIQFEAYLPDNDHRYDYDDSPGRMRIGEWDFHVDTAVVESNPAKRRRGTDGSLARQFLSGHGYEFPQDFAYARLVHLTDRTRRKELLVIFIEDLAPLGLTAAELDDGGTNSGQWPAVEKSHLEKIRQTMALLPRHGGG